MSESKAENLHREQIMQSEAISAQTRAQENLQTSMQISQALLDKATTTAANLQAMVDETVSRYREPTVLSVFGPYSPWTVSALLFSIIGALNPRAGLAVFLIGTCKSSPSIIRPV